MYASHKPKRMSLNIKKVQGSDRGVRQMSSFKSNEDQDKNVKTFSNQSSGKNSQSIILSSRRKSKAQ